METVPTDNVASSRQFLRAFARLVTGRTVNAAHLEAPAPLLWLLLGIGVLLWLLVDYWGAMPAPTFYPEALLSWSWFAVLLVALVGMMCVLSRPRVGFERVLPVALALVPLVIA